MLRGARYANVLQHAHVGQHAERNAGFRGSGYPEGSRMLVFEGPRCQEGSRMWVSEGPRRPKAQNERFARVLGFLGVGLGAAGERVGRAE